MKKNNKLALENSLRKIYEACQNDDAYSVHEICQFFNISYERVSELAATDKLYLDVLQICHERCKTNAEIAGLMSRSPANLAFKYII